MSSTGIKMNAKAAQSNPSSMSSSNPSLLLEKFNARRSTPDSEALASSDDDMERQEHQQPIIPQQKPTRRASWLNDTTPSAVQPRKNSFASSSMSPTTSHPSTPSAESGNWANAHGQNGSGIGRGAPGAFPWGSGIWNSERKDPPARLTEVLPSPTSAQPPTSAGNGYFGSESGSHQRDLSANSTIPFAIPLHPTPKTYRSQSYSVGQLETDVLFNGSAASTAGGPTNPGRGRPLQHSGLQHRPSRPSMLSEMSNEGGLAKLNEVEDDDDNSTNGSSNHGVQLQSAEARIKQLARENEILRQQQYQNTRIRPRSSTSNTFSLSSGYGLQDPVPEESEYAVDEPDEISELQEITSRGLQRRRMSEYGLGQAALSSYALENRKLENVKKAYWQSSNGLERLADISQSRRHSFADVPTRHGSISSAGEALSAHDAMQDNMSQSEYQSRYQDGTGYPSSDVSHAASYFGSIASQARVADHSSVFPSGYSAFGLGFSGRSESPHRSLYGVPQPRHNQLLYMVTFKFSRADVFYIQEGTGLSVKPGDLVIVEADRGTDLGTVAMANVDWAAAKDLKEHYAEEHYKWLMMYSQGAAGTSDGTGAGLMAASNGLQGSAVGGMGPPNQHGMQEPNPGEIKPKIIKRLAQPHETQALRDKEGNEAKAKRVCMQKVKEHGLHMEILDAEFQMDWKKLTFYYFADAYINFNSLVTDLFKVYKTRIWMSAINPASFASPSLGLQAPSGIGPGAVVTGGRNPQPERRIQPEQPSSYGAAQAGRGYASPFTQGFSPVLDRGAPPNTFQPSSYAYGYSPFAASPRNAGVSPGGYAPLLDTTYGGGFATPTDYSSLSGRFPSPHTSAPNHDGGDYRQSSALGTPNENWIGSFQSLSMNSR
ncbi:hypothetical protein B0O99DRAFT_655007 [Bisporella sp. PMI_857]|nr:hypothetical protein B0O99DRAFT_655007 [Bisporella sp. PMI_857]